MKKLKTRKDSNPEIHVIGLKGIPLVKLSDDIGKMIFEAAQNCGASIEEDDIIVIAQSIVSKSEGAIVKLKDVKPSIEAKIISEQINKDPEVVEVILQEAKSIIRLRGHHLITETRHGWICANSAVDLSNVSGGDAVTILPKDSDWSAKRIRERIRQLTGKNVAVIISDTFGRPFRMGQVNVAIGVSGLKPIFDRKGEKDLYGYQLRVKEIAVADELAAAAELVMGEADEGIPVAIIRGYKYEYSETAKAVELIRPREADLFI